MKRVFFFCLVFLAFFSCKKEEVSPSINWAKYYPLSEGNERIYECEQITIDVLAGIHDTSLYYIKEVVVTEFVDTNSCTVFAENCFRSNTPQGPWSPYISMSVQQYNYSFVRVEDNIPYQVLKFPAKKGFSWDLNAYNTLDEQQISYSNINDKVTITNTSYDSVLVVSQQDFKSLYTYQFAEEQYAKNVGLIYQKTIDVESQPTHANIDLLKPIEERITKGTISTFRLIDYTIK